MYGLWKEPSDPSILTCGSRDVLRGNFEDMKLKIVCFPGNSSGPEKSDFHLSSSWSFFFDLVRGRGAL